MTQLSTPVACNLLCRTHLVNYFWKKIYVQSKSCFLNFYKYYITRITDLEK